MPARPLRQQKNAKHDEGADDRRRNRAAEGKPAVVSWLVEKIPEGGAERPGQNKGGPEQQDP